MTKNLTIKTVILYSGKDSKSSALKRMLQHLQCVGNCVPKGCSVEFMDIEAPDFCFDAPTAKRLSKERSVVVILISPGFVAHPAVMSSHFKALVAKSGAARAHIFPIHCMEVENSSQMPWAKLVWTPCDRTQTIDAATDKDAVCDDAVRLLLEVVDRRLLGPVLPVPELAVYAGEGDEGEVERAIAPMLKMMRGLNYVLSWKILPGDKTLEFFANAAKAPKQVVFITARAMADDGIWYSVLGRAPGAGQKRLLISLYACRWHGMGFEEWPQTTVVPEWQEENPPTIGGKNSHSLWLQAYEAIAELVTGS